MLLHRSILRHYKVFLSVLCSAIVVGIFFWLWVTPRYVEPINLNTTQVSDMPSLHILKNLPDGRDPDTVYRVVYTFMETLPVTEKYPGGSLIFVTVHPLNESDIHPEDLFTFIEYQGRLFFLTNMSRADSSDFALLDSTKFITDPKYFYVEIAN